jgi:hypothetical protein
MDANSLYQFHFGDAHLIHAFSSNEGAVNLVVP